MLQKVKEGDWIFTCRWGWQRVLGNEEKISLVNGHTFRRSGKSVSTDHFPSAWPKGHPDIPHWAPERPKKMVQKSVEMVGRFSEKGNIVGIRSKEGTMIGRWSCEIPVTVSWEEEE
jgi:hypothetical protein